jgi:hypothetical protein
VNVEAMSVPRGKSCEITGDFCLCEHRSLLESDDTASDLVGLRVKDANSTAGFFLVVHVGDGGGAEL